MMDENEAKGWNGMKRKIAHQGREIRALRNIIIQRSGSADTISIGQDSTTINLREFPKSEDGGVGGGGGTSSHPWKMSFSLNVSNDPIVNFDDVGTEVYIQGTNDYYAPTAGSSGKPSNITSDIALTSNATNYIYVEAGYDDSSSTEPDDFAIVVYTTEQDLAVSATDTAPTPDEVYQDVGRRLIGTIQLNASDELTGDGLVQFTTSRLFAELFYVSSDTVYLMVP